MRPLHRVVILGGGFAGLRLARKLGAASARRHLAVTLVSRGESHLFTPGIYQLAGAVSDGARRKAMDRALALPLRRMLAGLPVSFVSGEVGSIDDERSRVTLADGRTLRYDTLVIALGSETAYYGIPGLEEHAIALKSIRDADRVNRTIAAKLRGRAQPLRITVAGGGPTGVELAAMLAEKVGKRQAGVTVTLLEAGPAVLPGFPAKVSAYVARELERRGVKVSTGSCVKAAREDAVILEDGNSITHDLLVWTGGTQAPALVAGLPFALDGGRLATDAPLTCAYPDGRPAPRVYALGDAACFRFGQSHAPWTAYAALKQADHAAANILRQLAGQPTKPFKLGRQPYVIPLGTSGGVAEWLRIPFRGRIVQLLALATEARYLARLLPLRYVVRALRQRVWAM